MGTTDSTETPKTSDTFDTLEKQHSLEISDTTYILDLTDRTCTINAIYT